MSDEDKKSAEQDANAQEVNDAEVDDKKSAGASEVTAETPEEKDSEKESEKEIKERPVWTMTVAKAQEEKRKAVEKAKQEAKEEAEQSVKAEIEKLKAEKAELEAKTNHGDDYREELQRVAEEHGLETKAVEGLLNVFKKSVKIPDLSKYDQILREKEIEGNKLQVSQEFDEKVVSLIQKDFPQATSQHIQEVKNKITELAFSKGYNTYKLEDIYRVKRDDFEFKNGYTAETSGGRSSDLRSFDKMTDEEEHQLASGDPAKYKEYVRAMSRNGSRYLD